MKDMKRFLYMAEGGRLNYIDSVSSEMVYSSIAYFYNPSTKVVVIDTETNEASIFTRILDKNGNLIDIIKNDIKNLWR